MKSAVRRNSHRLNMVWCKFSPKKAHCTGIIAQLPTLGAMKSEPSQAGRGCYSFFARIHFLLCAILAASSASFASNADTPSFTARSVALAVNDIRNSNAGDHLLRVYYFDRIRTGSLDDEDIFVLGPDGYSELAGFIDWKPIRIARDPDGGEVIVDPQEGDVPIAADGALTWDLLDGVVATYAVSPQTGRFWKPSDNGNYSVILQPDEVNLASGGHLASRFLGQFKVAIGDRPTPPLRTDIEIIQNGGEAVASVTMLFPSSGYRVDWGEVRRVGNFLFANVNIVAPQGAALTVITSKSHQYDLSDLESGDYVFAVHDGAHKLAMKRFSIAPRDKPPVDVGIAINKTDSGSYLADVRIHFLDPYFVLSKEGDPQQQGNRVVVCAEAQRVVFIRPPDEPAITDVQYKIGELKPGNYIFVFKLNGEVCARKEFHVGPVPPLNPKGVDIVIEGSDAVICTLDEPPSFCGSQHSARVSLTLCPGTTVAEWGKVERNGNVLKTNITIVELEDENGEAGEPPVARHTYNLGLLELGAEFVFRLCVNEMSVARTLFVGGPSFSPIHATADGLGDVVTEGNRPIVFRVVYRSSEAINVDSLGDDDIVMQSAPNADGVVSLELPAALTSVQVGEPGFVVAVYEVAPPEGGWSFSLNGDYSMTLLDGAVETASGNKSIFQVLGAFKIDIRQFKNPIHVWMRTPGVLNEGDREPRELYIGYTSVTDSPIDISTIGTGDLVVTPDWVELATFEEPPHPWLQTNHVPRLLRITPEINSHRVTAVYGLFPPPGGWLPELSGFYGVHIPAGEVSTTASEKIHATMVDPNLVLDIKPDRRERAKAVLSVEDVTRAGSQSVEVAVNYSSKSGIDVESLGDDDILIKSFARFIDVFPLPIWEQKHAQLVEVRQSDEAADSVVAIYECPAPDGGWTHQHNGRFDVCLEERSVRANSGLFALGGDLGHFTVRIDPTPGINAEAKIDIKKSDDKVTANVGIVFRPPLHTVVDWGAPRRVGNTFYLDSKAEPTDIEPASITQEHEYCLFDFRQVPREIPFRTAQLPGYLQYLEREEFVIRTYQEYIEWASAHIPPNIRVAWPPPAPVNFDKKMIIGVALGQTSGNHSVKIRRIEQSEDGNVVVHYVTRVPAPGDPVPEILLTPVDIVCIEQIDAPVEFKGREVVGGAGADETPVRFERVGLDPYLQPRPANVVFHSQDEWLQWFGENDNPAAFRPPIPLDVDWEKKMVVGTMLGRQLLNVSVRVQEVTSNGDRILVNSITSFGGAPPPEDEFHYPGSLVCIPKSDLPIEFHSEEIAFPSPPPGEGDLGAAVESDELVEIRPSGNRTFHVVFRVNGEALARTTFTCPPTPEPPVAARADLKLFRSGGKAVAGVKVKLFAHDATGDWVLHDIMNWGEPRREGTTVILDAEAVLILVDSSEPIDCIEREHEYFLFDLPPPSLPDGTRPTRFNVLFRINGFTYDRATFVLTDPPNPGLEAELSVTTTQTSAVLHAKLFDPDQAFKVTDWGPPEVDGRLITANVEVERIAEDAPDAERHEVHQHDYPFDSLRPGIYIFVLNVNGRREEFIGFLISGSTRDPFLRWLEGFFPERMLHMRTTGELMHPDDLEGDGISNLMEFALGLDPTQMDKSPGVTAEWVKDTTGKRHFAISFKRRADAESVVEYVVEASNNLFDWNGSPELFEDYTITDLGDGMEHVVVCLKEAEGEGSGYQYLRLKVLAK